MAEEQKIKLENGVELEYNGAYSDKELGNLYSPPKKQDTTDIKTKNYYTVSNTALDRAITNSEYKSVSYVTAQPSLFDVLDEIGDKQGILPLIKYEKPNFSKKKPSKDIVLLTENTKAFSNFNANDIKVFELSRALYAGKVGHRDELGYYKIDLRDFAKLCGKEIKTKGDYNNQYKIIRESIIKVGSLAIAEAGNIGSRNGISNIYQRFMIENGTITMKFSDWVIEEYINLDTTVTTRDLKGFTLKGDIPNRIYTYLQDRYTHKNNILKHINKIISVKSLLETLDKLLPTKEEAQKHLFQRRCKPIIEAFNYLQANGVLTSWQFCGAKAKPLTKEETANAKKSYSFFESLYIAYDMPLKDDESFKNYVKSLEADAQRRAEKKKKGK